jgi:hypothetical protein
MISTKLWDKIVEDTSHDSDRAAAIVAGSLLETTIERCILQRLLPMTKNEFALLFKGDSSLATFSAKIRIGYALGLYGPESRDEILKIKDIRNQFAHQFDRDFGTSEIINACKNLRDYPIVGLGVHPIDLQQPEEGKETRLKMRQRYNRAVWHYVSNIPRETRVITPPPMPKYLS